LKIVIAITGASGTHLGIKAYHLLPPSVEKYLILSDNAKIAAKKENIQILDDDAIWEGPASGSFGIDAMLIAPCSMNTLAKIACGIADNLTTRAASVILKEHKRLLLAPREIPLSPIALENMLKLSRLNVIIAPPILGYYSDPKDLEQMERFIIGKWFDLLRIEHDLYKRWQC